MLSFQNVVIGGLSDISHGQYNIQVGAACPHIHTFRLPEQPDSSSAHAQLIFTVLFKLLSADKLNIKCTT